MAGPEPGRDARARAVLAAEGLAADVRSTGRDGEIATVAAPVSSLAAVRAVAPKLRSLGYQFVAIDLARWPSTGETR